MKNNTDELIDRIIDLAFEEDIATGDITPDSIIPESSLAVAEMKAKADGVISGLEVVEKVFRKFQEDIVFTPYLRNGDRVKKGDLILKIEGSYPALLKAERTALNFFQRMSGIATETARYVEALTHSVKALDISMNIRLTKEYLVKAIGELKRRYNAVILAHYYVDPDVQDVADFVGDSLELSRKAAATDADVIVFCGVKFMAETAALLSPQKKVLLPDLDAGCSLADGVTGADLAKWKNHNPGGLVISYVNTTAETKAFTDICCTSANAFSVVDKMVAEDPSRKILFVPDKNLGGYINRKQGTRMELWKGCCHVHDMIDSDMIDKALEAYPEAHILIHPEAMCSSDPKINDNPRCHFFSTSGMIRFAKESGVHQLIVATEVGIMHRMAQEAPDKELIHLSDKLVCESMKKTSLLSLFECLLHQKHVIAIPEEISVNAVKPVKKMLDI